MALPGDDDLSDARTRRIGELLDRVRTMDREEREAFLADACGADSELLEEVLSLVRAREDMGDWLEEPAAAELGLPTSSPDFLAEGDPIGGYEILGVIDSGGSGTVYEALQPSPHRKVALKVMRIDLASESAQSRFREEAEILARLKHPGIAHVYDAGVEETPNCSVPYFAMEYVEGARTVVAHAEEAGLGTRDRLELVARVCDAVHHGHQRGVIHCDVKPGNVLVDGSGDPKVIDFGVARLAGSGDAPDRRLAGTLGYMSPELSEPGCRDPDVRTDVYALGVLLYEMLTGRLPHDVSGLTVAEALVKVREEEPLPVSVHDRSLRGDVEAIVHKAIAEERAARYASAAALADDLRRHLAGLPVEARDPGLLYLVGKLARRHRATAITLAALLIVVVASAVVGGWLAIERNRQRRSAEFEAYVANISAASSALRVDDVAEARRCLSRCPDQLRNWEWRHLNRRLDASLRTITWPDHSIRAGAVSPDGTLVAAAGEILGKNLEIRVWRAGSAEPLYTMPGSIQAYAVAFSPDSQSLVVGYRDGRLEIRDAGTGELSVGLEGHGDVVNAIDFDPEGARFATASSDATVRLWRRDSGELLCTLKGHEDRVISTAFHPFEDVIASGGRDGTIRLWRAATGEVLATLDGHEGSVEGVAFSPDGRRLVSGSRDHSVRLWDVEAGSEIAVRRSHRENVRSVAFSPDGSVFASASYDRSVRLWRGEDASAIATLRGHAALVHTVGFQSREGEDPLLVSFSEDGAVKFWEMLASVLRQKFARSIWRSFQGSHPRISSS
jgi:WD40 repeat protein